MMGACDLIFAGNLLSATDPDGNTTWTDYDALNRATKSVTARGGGPSDTH